MRKKYVAYLVMEIFKNLFAMQMVIFMLWTGIPGPVLLLYSNYSKYHIYQKQKVVKLLIGQYNQSLPDSEALRAMGIRNGVFLLLLGFVFSF